MSEQEVNKNFKMNPDQPWYQMLHFECFAYLLSKTCLCKFGVNYKRFSEFKQSYIYDQLGVYYVWFCDWDKRSGCFYCGHKGKDISEK